jgi:phosphatidylinositol glycan class F
VYPSLFTFLGAFIGAFPIALDWDRPWQAWPLTPLTGAILGCVAGNYYSFAVTAWETALELGAEDAAPAAATATPAAKKAKKLPSGAGKKVKKA